MNKASVFVATFAIAAVAMFSGYHVGSSKAASVSPSEQIAAPPKVINYEDYLELTSAGEDFFILIARPSCKFCAIVDDYILMELPPTEKPVYYLNLESYRHSDEYEAIKKVLDIDYVPTFQYYQGGKMLYNLNNPLSQDYFSADDNETLNKIHHDMEAKIASFIAGAEGRGTVISEEIKRPSGDSGIVSAEPIS